MAVVVISIVLCLLLVVLIVSFVIFHKDKKYVPPMESTSVNTRKSLEECSIAELADRIASEPLNQKQLLAVVSMVGSNHLFPSKSSGKSAADHLRFVHQFCLNTAAGGATIVKMSKTLKSINPSYKTEIEDQEREAISERDRAASKR